MTNNNNDRMLFEDEVEKTFEEKYGDATSELSDEYKISIKKLLYNTQPKNTEELKKLLDTNGFLGRYRIDSVGLKKDTEIKVNIELLDSTYFYNWPFRSSYSFYKREVLPSKPKFKYNMLMEDVMHTILCVQEAFGDDIPASVEYSKRVLLRYKREYGRHNDTIMDQLFELKLFKNDLFVLKSRRDCTEYCDNLFNDKLH